MKLNGAEIIIRLLEREGIDTVAGIPGSSNLPLYSALSRSSIRHVLTRHEQGAGFIAQGMARSTGKTAVCFATSGPGVTNLITPIADAKLDSVPVVAITGQVPCGMIGTDAFQEVPTYGMTMPITRHNYLVKNPKDLLWVLPEAFAIARSGRPGPVLIDVPKDVQTAGVEVDTWPLPSEPRPPRKLPPRKIERIAEMINRSRRPLLYAGGGIISAGASGLLAALARRNTIPVALTLMGLGAFPPDDPLYLGMLGMHGARVTNHLLDETDLLLAFGARFDDRAIGRAGDFCPHASIIHIDVDPSEIDKVKRSSCSLAGDIGTALEALLPLIEENTRPEWIRCVMKMKGDHPGDYPSPAGPMDPPGFIRETARQAGANAIVATDVGQHQMWVAQFYPFMRPRTLLTSSGLGTMGFGLPAAIGAALANPERTVICFTGDGSFQMNIQELATLAELDLNVKIFLMNNGHLGLVRQQQELFYGGNYIASRFERRLDFASIARDFGVHGIAMDGGDDPSLVIANALAASGPCVVDIPVHYGENVYPMVPPGAANRVMIGGRA